HPHQPHTQKQNLFLLEPMELRHLGSRPNLQHTHHRQHHHNAQQHPVEIPKPRSNHFLTPPNAPPPHPPIPSSGLSHTYQSPAPPASPSYSPNTHAPTTPQPQCQDSSAASSPQP